MVVDIWRDPANNKTYVQYGLEKIEVPHAIAEAYRQDGARLLKELKEEHVLAETLGRCYEDSKAENVKLKAENVKLRELVDKLLYGLEHDATPADSLVWTQEVDTMLHELGIEVKE